MEDASVNTIKSALYLDFDNVYLGLLRNNQKTAARAFAEDPGAWLAWFERGAHLSDEPTTGTCPRRILVRRCYQTPERFNYRQNFVRAGFSVIDCPALTTMGKNGADIYMVMDIIDALDHRTHFDEFIILSSDADFTPVLTRIREHDRRSTIVTNAMAAAALKAASDSAVADTTFIRNALGIVSDGQLLAKVGVAIHDALEESPNGTILLSALGERQPIREAKENLLKNRYCGHGSLLGLLKSGEIPGRHLLCITGNSVLIYDPERWAEPSVPANSDQPEAGDATPFCGAAAE
jgi:hypothetical protein